jgi:hypothetical protein
LHRLHLPVTAACRLIAKLGQLVHAFGEFLFAHLAVACELLQRVKR